MKQIKIEPPHVKRGLLLLVAAALLLSVAVGYMGSAARKSSLDFTHRPGPGSMVLVEAGLFIMGVDPDPGSPAEGRPDEQPAHRVFLDAYYIDLYEVTNAQYKRFVDDTGWRIPRWWKNGVYQNGMDYHPVTGVTWDDAAAYVAWAGKRLPTEAEWEKAARGPLERRYPWGNRFNMKKGNFQSEFTRPVGSYPAGVSPYGCYDMAGNVWEWVYDWYRSDYYQHSPQRNPKGPPSGTHHVLKGGSYHTEFAVDFIMKSATRYGKNVYPQENPAFGFRCAKDPAPGEPAIIRK